MRSVASVDVDEPVPRDRDDDVDDDRRGAQHAPNGGGMRAQEGHGAKVGRAAHGGIARFPSGDRPTGSTTPFRRGKRCSRPPVRARAPARRRAKSSRPV